MTHGTGAYDDSGLRFGEDELDSGVHPTPAQQKRKSPFRGSHHASDDFSYDEDGDDRPAVAGGSQSSIITPSALGAVAAPRSVGDRQSLPERDAVVRGQGLGLQDEDADGSPDDAADSAVP